MEQIIHICDNCKEMIDGNMFGEFVVIKKEEFTKYEALKKFIKETCDYEYMRNNDAYKTIKGWKEESDKYWEIKSSLDGVL